MGSIKLKIHPLFYFWLLFEITVGNVFTFIVYTLTALVHEMGHSLTAIRRGYELNRVVLSPFGAVVTGDADFDLVDQIKIALAGPLVNALIGVILVGAWWAFPELYAYTDVMATANFSMALVNLLPCYPLDGGRILFSVLAKKLKEDKAYKACKVLGVVVSVIFLVVFAISLKSLPNPSALLFSVFMLFGALSAKRENRYVKIYTSVSQKKLRRGMRYNKVALDEEATVKTLVSILDQNAVNEVVVFSKGEIKKVLDQNSLEKLLERAVYREKISKYL